MYTFEDDHDTSSSYNSQHYNASQPTLPTIPDAGLTAMATRPDTGQNGEGQEHRPAPPAQGAPSRTALIAMLIVCVGVFITALDQTVVVTALPQMITDLSIPLTQLDRAAWIISAYLLGFVVVMPLVGRVSDVYGRRRIFLVCLLLFGIGSLLCGLAPQLGRSVPLTFLSSLHIDTSSPGLVWLIGARILQAIGGGAVVPVAMAVASDVYPLRKRGLILGIIGAVTEAGGAIGPLYGALIVGHLGWQYIFYLNIPLVLLLLVAACFGIPRGQRLHEGIDWAGALLLGLALTCLSLGLAQQGSAIGPVNASTGTTQSSPLALILAGVFLVAFILVERHTRWPIVPLSLFKSVAFSASAIASLLIGAALIIALSDIPIFVDTVLRLSVLDSGLTLLRLTLLIPIGAVLGGWLCNRITCRFTALIGLLCTASGFYLMSHWSLQPDWTQMTEGTMIAGLGFGLVVAPISTTALNTLHLKQAGTGSAIITALRMVGMMLGLAILTSWALAYFRQLILSFPTSAAAISGDPLKNYAAYALNAEHTVYTTVFFISALICLVALVPALFLWGRQKPLSEQASLPIEDQPTAPVSRRAAQGTGTVGIQQIALNTTNLVLIALLLIGTCSAAVLGLTGLANNQQSKIPTRTIELALSEQAITPIFASQLGKQQIIDNLQARPTANDGLQISFKLRITFGPIHRTMPIALDSTMHMDGQHNIQLTVQHVRRDGNEAGPDTARGLQGALNQLLSQTIMPTLRQQLKGITIVAVHTSQNIACGKHITLLVLEVAVSTIQGIPGDAIPSPLCFHDALNLNTLFKP